MNNYTSFLYFKLQIEAKYNLKYNSHQQFQQTLIIFDIFLSFVHKLNNKVYQTFQLTGKHFTGELAIHIFL